MGDSQEPTVGAEVEIRSAPGLPGGQAEGPAGAVHATHGDAAVVDAARVALEIGIEGGRKVRTPRVLPLTEDAEVGQGQAGDGLVAERRVRANRGRLGEEVEALEPLAGLPAEPGGAGPIVVGPPELLGRVPF